MASWLRMRLARWMQWCAVAAALACTLSARSGALTQQPTLYLVGYAHLDTQWRWEYPTVITEYLPKTLFQNFALFEEYPDYIFNFTGANRYELIKEYFPR
jgi:alpha-mannosidase